MLVGSSQRISSYLYKSALIVTRRSSAVDTDSRQRRIFGAFVLFPAVTWKSERWTSEVFVPSVAPSSGNIHGPAAPLQISVSGLADTDGDAHDSTHVPHATVELFLDVGEVEVNIARVTPLQLFWAIDDHALYISTDPRWLPNVAASGIDPAGVYTLLKFRSCLPPFTIWRRAHRLPPAVRTRIDIAQQRVVSSTKSPYESSRFVERDGRGGESSIREALDSYLDRATVGRRPVVFFSGGVDSSLLAWRLQAIGRKDTVLLHSTRGTNNPETIRARAIASELQMDLVEVGFDRTYALQFLAQISRRLHYPIGSASLIEMAQLCDRVADFGAGIVAISGTGADGLFGLNATVSRIAYVERCPRWIRQLARVLFDAYLWRSPSGLPGRVAALAKRSLLTRPPAALAIAPDPFEDIFYHVAPQLRDAVTEEARRWCEFATSEREPLLFQCRVLDLMSVCAGTYAQRQVVHFANRDEDVVFPFLDAGFISKVIGKSYMFANGKEEKGNLKRLLATRISPALVYAKKYGFQDDVLRYVADREISGLIDSAISACGRDFEMHLDLDKIRKTLQKIRDGQAVGARLQVAWNAALLILWQSQMMGRS